MKEIWMNKLIELLDQYRKQNPREFFGDEGSLVVLTWKDFIELNRLIIISKEYEFIKWLVDNDKIDIDKIDKKIRIYDYVEEYEEYDYVFPDIYKQLLMILSISSSPIDDLISYLK